KLHEMGIVYAPDFVINAGGVINVADEMVGYNQERAMKKVENIYDNLKRVFEISKEENIPTYVAADRMAEERIENISHLRDRKSTRLNSSHVSISYAVFCLTKKKARSGSFIRESYYTGR